MNGVKMNELEGRLLYAAAVEGAEISMSDGDDWDATNAAINRLLRLGYIYRSTNPVRKYRGSTLAGYSAYGAHSCYAAPNHPVTTKVTFPEFLEGRNMVNGIGYINKKTARAAYRRYLAK